MCVRWRGRRWVGGVSRGSGEGVAEYPARRPRPRVGGRRTLAVLGRGPILAPALGDAGERQFQPGHLDAASAQLEGVAVALRPKYDSGVDSSCEGRF